MYISQKTNCKFIKIQLIIQYLMINHVNKFNNHAEIGGERQ